MNDIAAFSILGLVQGLTEFLPVSSTGHLILAREFFGFSPENGLAIDAVLQLATALAVVVYFWPDLTRLARAALSWAMRGPVLEGEKSLILALVAGTIPAVILGLLLEGAMGTTFRSATLVAGTLVAGALVMLAAEFFAKRFKSKLTVEGVGWKKGFFIGLFQSIALVPGMSRSGMTISGGLFLGLSREVAARFGFLLAVPIILGSGAKKLLDLGFDGTLVAIGPALLTGGIVAFVSGLAAIHVLLLFVRTQPLYVFIAYRLALAAVIVGLTFL